MRHNKEIVTAVGTLALAIGIGFVMQNTELAKERYNVSPTPEARDTQKIQTGFANESFLRDVSDVHLTSASFPRVRSAAGFGIVADHIITRVAAKQEATDASPRASCAYSAKARNMDGGLIKLSLEAPCYPNERVTIHHNGLILTEATDDDGALTTFIPALAQRAVVLMEFSNGDGAVVQTHVEEFSQYGRTVLQWQGDAGFQIHAREFGADYGSSGHVWAGSETPIDSALDTDSGFVVRLGNADVPQPHLAEIYTYPLGKAKQRGMIDLTVEAEIHARNCGMDIEAQSIEILDGKLRTQDVVLSIPDCDAIGSFLVLNNLISDMKVAAR